MPGNTIVTENNAQFKREIKIPTFKPMPDRKRAKSIVMVEHRAPKNPNDHKYVSRSQSNDISVRWSPRGIGKERFKNPALEDKRGKVVVRNGPYLISSLGIINPDGVAEVGFMKELKLTSYQLEK